MTSPSLRSSLNNKTDQRIIIEYNDTTRAWNDLKHGHFASKSTVRESYRVSLAECTKTFALSHENSIDRSKSIETFDIPGLVRQAPEIGQLCSICRRYQGQIYPCRICGKVYHQQCIRDLGHSKSAHLMKTTTNLIGWSCPMCEDLRGLLPSNELDESLKYIKSLNVQTTIPLDTYVRTRFHLNSPNMIDADHFNDNIKQILQTYLNSIAEISSNRLTPTDLLILEISLKLLQIPANQLVQTLTTFELYRLSQLFLRLSSPDHQHISSDQFERIFRSYLRTTMSDFPNDNDNNEDLHLDALAFGILGRKAKIPRTWPQFLLQSTLPTLLNRYNHRNLTDFLNRILSSQRSSTPTAAELLEQVDQQAVSNLIKNLFEKLRTESPNRRKATLV